MLNVILEVHCANTGLKKTLGTILIANDGTGTQKLGNYDYVLRTGERGKLIKGTVKGYRRKSDKVWKLLHKVLQDAKVLD